MRKVVIWVVVIWVLVQLEGCARWFSEAESLEVRTEGVCLKPLRLPPPPQLVAPKDIEPIIMTPKIARKMLAEVDGGRQEPFVLGCLTTEDRLRLDYFYRSVGGYIEQLNNRRDLEQQSE